jgi:geranylgeranyl diphosphate synthase type II
MHSLKSLKNAFTCRLEQEAERIGSTEPANLYQPIQYTLNMGGKRLRPVMVLMACDLFGGSIEAAMPAALGIEIFHNFTLLHDDIMDKAAVRRNMPTVHEKYSGNIAILSGDAMSNLAYQYLLQTKSPALPEIIGLFAKTATEVCEGQQFDMDYEESLIVSINDYLNMIRLKTAVLIACSLKTGAMIGNASPENARILYDFGINLGLAFQLQDDLLDVYADQDTFGKKIGGDIVANKKTFLLLKALELATPVQKKELLYRITAKDFNPEEKIATVKQLYTEINIRQITGEVTDNYYRKAITGLETIPVEQARKEELFLLAQKIMKRKK